MSDQQQPNRKQGEAQHNRAAHGPVDRAVDGGVVGSEGGGWDPGEHRDSDKSPEHGGADRRDDTTGPLQDGEKRGNTTRADAGGGDHGRSR